jgi:ribosomal protein S18 acetylase RimI-like enzyme
VIVRPATIDDVPQVAALRVALLHEEKRNPFFADPHPEADARALGLTRADIETPAGVFFVAVRGESIVGMLRCRVVHRSALVAESRQAAVTTVYVVPDQRRTGVLRALLAAADDWCRQQRLRGMRLQCATTNDAGRKAWESLGFSEAEIVYIRSVPKA